MKTMNKSPRPRNLLHDHPLLKKGGIHGKSHKADRRQQQMQLSKQLKQDGRSEWPNHNISQSMTLVCCDQAIPGYRHSGHPGTGA